MEDKCTLNKLPINKSAVINSVEGNGNFKTRIIVSADNGDSNYKAEQNKNKKKRDKHCRKKNHRKCVGISQNSIQTEWA